MDVEAFIDRWTRGEGGAERANYQMFLAELCDVIGVKRPEPAGADHAHNDYVFERAVRPRKSAPTVNPKRIDLYKRGAFILEAKQSRAPAQTASPQLSLLESEAAPIGRRDAARGWDSMMQNARRQAEDYVFLLDADHTAPPFIITCDVGSCLELFADFTGTGRAYDQFPNRNGFRIFMDDLRRPEARKLLADVWGDPRSLDPSRNSARVTREIASRLADVSKALEKTGAHAEDVAHFLMRCVFTMFAEDTDLLPRGSFAELLKKSVADPTHFPVRLKTLWADMEKGSEFSHVIEARVRHFNGGLFKNTTVFELGREEIGELLAAAEADWKLVDPAIFGTLLEQALDKDERKKLGAHYTPRTYVQRLVDVTIMEPLRADWQAALTRAEQAREDGDLDQARAIVRAFHHHLCATRVLDPACGTGNFLYVSLELMKKLEGDVIQALRDLGDTQENLAMAGETVDPHQFLGLELNPRAAAIAELVVWIGYLQWHYRNNDGHPNEPILKAFKNINFGRHEGYDAVLTWDGYPIPAVRIAGGNGEESYPNPRRPAWPEAEFIVGNPPFIGSKRLGTYLTRAYVDALRVSEDEVPPSVDYVMYWWNRAASLVSAGAVRRVGLVSTNTITQFYNRRVLARFMASKKRVSLAWAVPDHPWIDTEDGAAVRVSFGCLVAGQCAGVVEKIAPETRTSDDGEFIKYKVTTGKINEKFEIGASIYDSTSLKSNSGLCWQGVKLVGDGFRIDRSKRDNFVDLDPKSTSFLKRYITGMALNQRKPPEWVIDFFGLDQKGARLASPILFQHLLEFVKPARIVNRDDGFREKWWLFGRPRPELRDSIEGISRYIATSEVSKHRNFAFLDTDEFLPDGGVIAIASDKAWIFSVLSSSIHLRWTLWGAGLLENRPRYQNQLSFDPFPFPDPSDALKGQLGALGDELDSARKEVRAAHVDLTLTGLYNLLEKVKAGDPLSFAEQDVKQRGRVLVLKEIHDQIDALTNEAYGWPGDLSDEEIVERLIALNADRAREESAGIVRWLRPEYQISRYAKGAMAREGDLDLIETVVDIDRGLPVFPSNRLEQPLAVEAMLAAAALPMDAAGLARGFRRGGKRIERRISETLITLSRYGRVVDLGEGRYAARRAA